MATQRRRDSPSRSASDHKLCQNLRQRPPTLTDETDAEMADFQRPPTPTSARNWLPKQVRYRTAPRPEVVSLYGLTLVFT